MPYRDSLDKIIFSYFRCVTNQSFTYKNKKINPKPLQVSPLLLRGFTCPPNCGACCPRFSLDYLPSEFPPYDIEPRKIEFNKKEYTIYSDLQEDHNDHFCRNLNKDNGRCGIHGKQPFSCDFELIRFFNVQDTEKPNRLNQQLFGRKWAMKNVRGTRGTSCEMTAPDAHTISEVRRKLSRLEQWCFYFDLIDTKIPEILEWVDGIADLAIDQKDFNSKKITKTKIHKFF